MVQSTPNRKSKADSHMELSIFLKRKPLTQGVIDVYNVETGKIVSRRDYVLLDLSDKLIKKINLALSKYDLF